MSRIGDLIVDVLRRASRAPRSGTEISNLMDLVASGISATTIAPKIREREGRVTALDVKLRSARPAPPNIEKLREALHQPAEQLEGRPSQRTEGGVSAAASSRRAADVVGCVKAVG
jgi:hypothetical protein